MPCGKHSGRGPSRRESRGASNDLMSPKNLAQTVISETQEERSYGYARRCSGSEALRSQPAFSRGLRGAARTRLRARDRALQTLDRDLSDRRGAHLSWLGLQFSEA